MDKFTPRLNEIATHWSNVFQAQESQGDTAAAARNQLLVRYHEAVLRYFRGELRDDHAADKLFSNFAVRVLEVDAFLKRADPNRGRFRDYLKAVLRRMVIDHYREQQREAQRVQELIPGSDNEPAESSSPPADEEEQRFLACWRQELINQAWKALEQVEGRSGQPYGTLLRLQENTPGIRSAQLAEKLAALVGRPFTAAGVRQLVHRGRELFGDLLIQEVARSLKAATDEEVNAERLEQELIELGLLFSYCKAALERFRGNA